MSKSATDVDRRRSGRPRMALALVLAAAWVAVMPTVPGASPGSARGAPVIQLQDGAAMGGAHGLPPGFIAQPVASRAEIDGRLASIWTFSAATDPFDAAALVESNWREHASAPVLRDERSEWLIVSRPHLDTLETIQIRRGVPMAQGYLTRWSTVAAGLPRRMVQWLPPSVRIGRELVSLEGPVRVTTVVGSSDERPDRLLESIAYMARRAGLRRIDVHRGSGAGGSPLANPHSTMFQPSADARVARFAGNGRDLFVTLDRGAGLTAVVTHFTETDR